MQRFEDYGASRAEGKEGWGRGQTRDWRWACRSRLQIPGGTLPTSEQEDRLNGQVMSSPLQEACATQREYNRENQMSIRGGN